MTNEDVLNALKFAGPVVGLISFLWGSTQKISVEDGGVKRLTMQGKTLVGITVLATLISLIALGLEIVIKQRQAADERAGKRLDEQTARIAEERKRVDIEARDLRALWRGIAADASERDRFLAQRLLIIGNASEEQRRDARLSLRVARESSARLSEFERTLAEFERINYPLRKIEISVSLVLDLPNNRRTEAFWKELATRTDLDVFVNTRNPDAGKIVTFKPDQIRSSAIVSYAARGRQMFVVFVKGKTAADIVARGDRDELTPTTKGFAVGAAFPPIRLIIGNLRADLKYRTIVAHYDFVWTPKTDGVIASGEKLSISDIKKMLAMLKIETGRPDESAAYIARVSVTINDLRHFDYSPASDVARPKLGAEDVYALYPVKTAE